MELWDVYDCNREKTGRTHERGKPMSPGDYHVVVHIWIQNSKGEFLITKRSPNKVDPDIWECTGGSAIAGDTSLDAALREVKEETGLTLDPDKGKIIFSYKRDKYNIPDFCDVWLFRQDFPLSDVVLQEGETCDAKWATEEEIKSMISTGEFYAFFDYLESLFKEAKGQT